MGATDDGTTPPGWSVSLFPSANLNRVHSALLQKARLPIFLRVHATVIMWRVDLQATHGVGVCACNQPYDHEVDVYESELKHDKYPQGGKAAPHRRREAERPLQVHPNEKESHISIESSHPACRRSSINHQLQCLRFWVFRLAWRARPTMQNGSLSALYCSVDGRDV